VALKRSLYTGVHAHRCTRGVADWSLIAKVKNNPRIHIPIFGNGDIDSAQKAVEYKNRYGVDGIMIGRAAIGYPWIFREIKHFEKTVNYFTANYHRTN
jgi:tRNA-dihydrouridine synthase